MEFDQHGNVREDKNLPIVEFYSDAIHDEAASKREGRPIYTDIEMVKIAFPADRQRNLIRPAHAQWKKVRGEKVTYAMRFPEQYRRFKAAEPQIVEGTPISEAPFLTAAQRATLKHLQVFTVEQLASLSGQPMKNLGAGGMAMVQQAIAYMDNATGSANVTALAEENARLKAMLEEMQREPVTAPENEFDGMDDSELKSLIKDATGAAPKGNPSRSTLESMAKEAGL